MLPTRIKKYLSLEFLVYLAVFLLPVYLIRLEPFGLPTNVLEILIGIIFISHVGRAAMQKTRPLFPIKLGGYGKYAVLLGLMLGGIIISAVLNPGQLKGFGIIKGWFIIPIIFAYLSASILKEKKKNIFLAYYLSAGAVACISLGYLIFSRLTYDGRLQVFFNSPNYLAMYLAPGIIAGILFLSFLKHKNLPESEEKIEDARLEEKKFKIIFLAISLSIMLIAIYKTYSYSAWLSILTSISIVLLVKNKVFSKKMFIAAIILVLLFFSQLNNKKFRDLSSLDSRSSLSSRNMIWKSSALILKDHWLLGIGPGNFQEAYLANQKYFPSYLEWAVPHPHNIYLSLWLSGGIIAFLGFLGLVFFWLRDMFMKKKVTAIQLAAIGIMIYILLHGFFDTTYFKNDLAIVFWLNFLFII